MSKAKVGFTSCPDYDPVKVREALKDCLAPLGGMESYVKPGDKVLIKPNLLAAEPPEKQVTTHPALVAEAARLALEAGGKVVIGDSPALDSFSRVARKTGMIQVAESLGVELHELRDPARAEPHSQAVFRKLELAREALEADVIINIPKLKTHCQMLITLSVKNLFGTVVAQRKAEWHAAAGLDRDAFASLLLDIQLALKPGLNILDGVWGMQGRGPSNGDPVHFGFLAAATDCLELDTAVCRLLGVELKSVPVLRQAFKRGFVKNLDNAAQTSYGIAGLETLQPLELPDLDTLDLLPGFLSRFFQKRLTSKPQSRKNLCKLCGKCAEICPQKCITMTIDGVVIDYTECIRCYCCQEVCPFDAMGFKAGLLSRTLALLGR